MVRDFAIVNQRFKSWLKAKLSALFFRLAEYLEEIPGGDGWEAEQFENEQPEEEPVEIEKEANSPKVELQKIGRGVRLHIRYESAYGKCNLLLDNHTQTGRLINGEVYFWLDDSDRCSMAKYKECKFEFGNDDTKERFIFDNNFTAFTNSSVRRLSLDVHSATPEEWKKPLTVLSGQTTPSKNGESSYTLVLQKDLHTLESDCKEMRKAHERARQSMQRTHEQFKWLQSLPGLANNNPFKLHIEAESNPDTGELLALRVACPENELWKAGTKLVLRTPDDEKRFEVSSDPVRIPLVGPSESRDSAILPITIGQHGRETSDQDTMIVALVTLPEKEQFDCNKHVIFLRQFAENDVSEEDATQAAQDPTGTTETTEREDFPVTPQDVDENDWLFELVYATLTIQEDGSLLRVKYGAPEIYNGEANLIIDEKNTIAGEVDDFEILFVDIPPLIVIKLMNDENVILDLPSLRPRKTYWLLFYMKPADYDKAYDAQHPLKFDVVA